MAGGGGGEGGDTGSAIVSWDSAEARVGAVTELWESATADPLFGGSLGDYGAGSSQTVTLIRLVGSTFYYFVRTRLSDGTVGAFVPAVENPYTYLAGPL